jgi:membrane fusion protein (multidrug efflux system)
MMRFLPTMSLATVCFYVLLFACRAGAATPPPPAVFVAPVVEVAFADTLEALGTLRANESILLTASVTETVTHIHFDDGDRVKVG